MSKTEAEHKSNESLVKGNLWTGKVQLVVDKDTGKIGTPGSFYGEHSINGMPIHQQTLEEYHKEQLKNLKRP
jgi:fructosamine-3-kinase